MYTLMFITTLNSMGKMETSQILKYRIMDQDVIDAHSEILKMELENIMLREVIKKGIYAEISHI